jgi:integrase
LVAELKLSAASVAHAHTVLAGILDDAVVDRRLAANPARGVKLPRKIPKARNYLTAMQASALANESKYPDIVLLLATTGLRWGEWRRSGSVISTSVVAGFVSSVRHRR